MFPLKKKSLLLFESWRNFCVFVHMCSRSTMRGTTPSRWWWWSQTKLTWPAGSPPHLPPLLLLQSQYWISMRPLSSHPTLKSSVLKRGCLLTPPSLLLLHWIQTASSSRLSGREEWQQVLLSVCLKLRMSIFLSDHKCQSFMFLIPQTHTQVDDKVWDDIKEKSLKKIQFCPKVPGYY